MTGPRPGGPHPKKLLEPSRRAEAVKALQSTGLSQREVCAIVKARRRSSRETPTDKAQNDAQRATRLTEVAHAHAEHGCRRLYEDYERAAVPGDEYMNYKRFRRLYRLANLQIGRRRRRGRARIVRGKPLRRATKPFEGWTLDFVHDRLFNGRAFRTLTVEDECSRLGLALEKLFSFPSRLLIAVLDDIAAIYGYPKYLRIDNGPEFVSLHLDQWAYWTSVKVAFSRPGRPSDNAFCESFNNRMRQELLNPNWFASLDDARRQAAGWRIDYNTNHPHSSLGDLTPDEFAERAAKHHHQAAISGPSVG